jgi:peptidoglycan/LPS O-acetylase OafA/YrhL
MQRSEHYQNLDAVRGIAAQVVLVGHIVLLVAAPASIFPPLEGWGWSGRLSVLVFFCLSGFAIATTIRRGFVRVGRFDWIEYAIRRIARVYPPYLAAILAAAAITVARLEGVHFAALKMEFEPFSSTVAPWLRALTFTFLQQANDALPATNVAIWSLRIEIILYAVAACVALSLGGTRLRRIIWAGLGCFALLVLFRAFVLGPTAAALFGFGALAALLRDRVRPSLLGGFACFTCAALLPLFVPLLARDGPTGLAYQGLTGLLIGVWLISLAQVPAVEGWVGRALIDTGRWSYTLYILHAPTLVALRAVLDVTVGGYGGTLSRRMAIVCGSFLVANLVAYGVALLVERPSQFAGWMEQILRRRSGRMVPTELPMPDR